MLFKYIIVVFVGLFFFCGWQMSEVTIQEKAGRLSPRTKLYKISINETERKYFVKFMQDFMHKYGDLADDIYECIRNGLAHDYVVKENKANHRKFIITGKQGEKHLSPHPVNSNVFFLNRDAYARDFLIAQKNYFKKL